MKEKRITKYGFCPYLGLRSDPETAMSYPCAGNRCFHAKGLAAIDLGHQEEFCLTNRYPECEKYALKPDAPLSVNIPLSSGRKLLKRRKKNNWVWGIVLVIIGIIVVWFLMTQGKSLDKTLNSSADTGESIKTITEIVSPVNSKTPTSNPTLTPTLPIKATSRAPLGLETPLGIDHKFVIVQVKEGDSLDLIARKHGTTVAAVVACNYRLLIPLVSGGKVVVPINNVDVHWFPAFEVYSISEETTLEELATRLSVDLEKLKYYNAVDDHFIAMAGDWLLIPRAGTPTP